ncbi:uncharacterized protein TNCV_2923071 [Trichonephila clavipes]|nr:uncharacterized protein TNCV_2923071 [Trichonephila clavipes]
MGTRLRKSKQMSSKLSDGKSIGGKGRLTDRMIDLITTYYGNAIRQNKTCLSDMRKAVWAVYFHIRSSDEEPLHSFCPLPAPGNRSNERRYREKGSGNDGGEKGRNGREERVTEKAGLKVWNKQWDQILSAIIFLSQFEHGRKRTHEFTSTNEAIVIFNDGNQGRLKIMQSLGLTVGQFAHKFVTLVDIKRIQTAEVHFNLRKKEVRQAKRIQFKTTYNYAVRHAKCYRLHLNPCKWRLSQSVISSMPTSSFNGVVPRSHCVDSRHVERLTTGRLPKHSVRSNRKENWREARGNNRYADNSRPRREFNRFESQGAATGDSMVDAEVVKRIIDSTIKVVDKVVRGIVLSGVRMIKTDI